MLNKESQSGSQMIKGLVQPWQESLANPAAAQDRVLPSLLGAYSATEYGSQHGAHQIKTLKEFRQSFPVVTYEDYKPFIKQVMAGNTRLLLNEEPIGWLLLAEQLRTKLNISQ